MSILLTGGAGFIGSHTCVSLLNQGDDVIVVDNLYNASRESLARVQKITGKSVRFYEVDCCDESAMDKVFSENRIECIVHFAGYKAVGESVSKPLEYYDNNLNSTLVICRLMRKHHVNNIVFSSSATVYCASNKMPVDETSETGHCTNPYGWTKYMIEQILRDTAKALPEFSVVLLRYFNPVGAHESGLIGEDPAGIPNNLFPYICQTAIGKREILSVFGDDYDTPDGTGVRDYIHVVDLADAHVCAIRYALSHKGCEPINIGTGVGYSVLDMVKAFEKANGVKVPYKIVARRPGDIGTVFSNPKKAETLLGWHANKTLEDMCRDAWNWQRKNPNGYSC